MNNKQSSKVNKLNICSSHGPFLTAIGLFALSPLAAAVALEEVVVTASKRGAAAAQDIPIAIAAFDASRMEAMGATQFDQWAGQISGLNFEDWGPGDKDYVIRGINSPTGSTVGVYYDESVVTGRFLENGGGRQVDIKLHDLERVEVLKGPQGTLYGANSMSGTIKYITNKPSLSEIEGTIETEIGQTDSAGDLNTMVNGMINIPLVEDTLGFRFVGWQHDNSGYIDNNRYDEEDVNEDETQGFRAQLKWQANDSLSFLFSYTKQDQEADNNSRITPSGVPVFSVDPNASGIPGPAFPTVSGGDNISTEVARTPWDENAEIIGLTAEWELDAGTLTATTNRFTRDINYIYDSTPILIFFGAARSAASNQIQEREISSSELRFASSLDGSFNFVVGALYQQEEINFDLQVLSTDQNGNTETSFSPLDSDDIFIGDNFGVGTIFGRDLTAKSQNTAFFGESYFIISDQWDATLGIRHYTADHESESSQTHPFFGFQGNGITFQEQVGDDSKTTYKANLTWKPSEEDMFYFNVATGFRQGGTNAVIIPGDVVLPSSFDSDELMSYELGAKTSWLDGSLILNGAIYHIDWEDMQTGSSIQSFSFTANLGEVSVDGMELDLQYRVNENWEISLGGSWISTELQEDEPSTVGDFPGLSGDELTNVPAFTGYGSITYNQTMTNDLDLSVRYDINYRGAAATELRADNTFYHKLPAYTVSNFNVSLSNDSWRATLFVNNLFNGDDFVDIIHDDQDQLSGVALKPRTAGVRLKYSF